MKTQSQKAFSLIEIIVVVAIFSLIIVLVGSFQSNILVYNKYSSDVISSAQDARSILRTMVQEMRSAKTGNNGSYPIVQVATSTIVFFSDTDADGLQEQIRYFITTTTLTKGVIKPSGSPLSYNPGQEKFSILAYNIKNGTSTSLFEYFDSSYNGTSSPLVQPVAVNTIRLVRINLLIDADPRRSPLPRLYTSDATFRNLKDNL
ncbi:MAG: type II secretion system protein [Patescibacteria group bacterium]